MNSSLLRAPSRKSIRALEFSLLVEVTNQAGKVSVARDDHRALVVGVVDHRLEDKLRVHVPLEFLAAQPDLLEDERVTYVLENV